MTTPNKFNLTVIGWLERELAGDPKFRAEVDAELDRLRHRIGADGPIEQAFTKGMLHGADQICQQYEPLRAENVRLSASVEALRGSLIKLVDAMHRYELDVDESPPWDHVEMVETAERVLRETAEGTP